MTLQEVFDTLVAQQALHQGRVANIKTSLGKLATALGYDTPAACPLAAAIQEPETWSTAINAYFQALTDEKKSPGAGTRRNTKDNLRTFFRAADAAGLLQAPQPLRLLATPSHTTAAVRQWFATSPYRIAYDIRADNPRHYRLRQAQWPPDVATGWAAFVDLVCDELREVTLEGYVDNLGDYFGWLTHVEGRVPQWQDCFDLPTLRTFVRWHTKRVGRPPVSAHAHHLICQVAKIAKALELPQAFALAKYRNGLRPQPVHNKEDHHVPLDVLMQVANANIAEGRLTLVPQWRDEHPEARQPRFPGARRATRFARGLMLRLLLRHPKRQRNIRELQFRHLSRTNGHCTVVIRGADLKIGWRGGEVNEDRFDLADDPTLLALFEEWLTVHRPKLPGAATSPYIFLTHTGRPHTQGSLRHALGYDVYQRTGIRWFPHMIRTTWATTYLDEEADYDVAAEALGDKPETVMQTYRKSTREVLQAKALAFYKKTFKR